MMLKKSSSAFCRYLGLACILYSLNESALGVRLPNPFGSTPDPRAIADSEAAQGQAQAQPSTEPDDGYDEENPRPRDNEETFRRRQRRLRRGPSLEITDFEACDCSTRPLHNVRFAPIDRDLSKGGGLPSTEASNVVEECVCEPPVVPPIAIVSLTGPVGFLPRLVAPSQRRLSPRRGSRSGIRSEARLTRSGPTRSSFGLPPYPTFFDPFQRFGPGQGGSGGGAGGGICL